MLKIQHLSHCVIACVWHECWKPSLRQPTLLAVCSDVDFGVFGPLVFKLLKLYFTEHPSGKGRCLLDTIPDEASWVAQQTGMQLYQTDELDMMYFSAEMITVSESESQALLNKLHDKVEEIVRDLPYPIER